MKKILIITLTVFAMAISAKAQTAPDNRSASEIIKEQKAKEKAAKAAQLNQSFIQAGCSAQETEQAKAIVKEMDQKGKALRADTTLTGEEIQLQRKAIDTEKKTRLIAVMGETKYKNWQAIRKQLALTAPFIPNL